MIPWADADVALRAMGIETENLMAVEMEPWGVTTTHLALDDDGRPMAAGREVATIVRKIPFDSQQRRPRRGLCRIGVHSWRYPNPLGCVKCGHTS